MIINAFTSLIFNINHLAAESGDTLLHHLQPLLQLSFFLPQTSGPHRDRHLLQQTLQFTLGGGQFFKSLNALFLRDLAGAWGHLVAGFQVGALLLKVGRLLVVLLDVLGDFAEVFVHRVLVLLVSHDLVLVLLVSGGAHLGVKHGPLFDGF